MALTKNFGTTDLVQNLLFTLITIHLHNFKRVCSALIQTHWPNKLTLFDFTIKYRTGKSNMVADALSLNPFIPNSSLARETDSDKVKVISYLFMWKKVNWYLKILKVNNDLKLGVQSIGCAVEALVQEEEKILVLWSSMTVSEEESPIVMVEEQQRPHSGPGLLTQVCS